MERDLPFSRFTMDCGRDGDMPWDGHIRCMVCDRIHHLDTAPLICDCGTLGGRKLRPDIVSLQAYFHELELDDKLPKAERRYTGRPVCPQCAAQRAS
jgi:hypothetical protein